MTDDSKRPDPVPHPDGGEKESTDDGTTQKHTNSGSSLHNAKGWDGKLRVEKRAVLVNPEVLDGHVSDADESDDENGPAVDRIEADEGISTFGLLQSMGRQLTC
jgi:protein phosphatase 1 regulatory subunit 7